MAGSFGHSFSIGLQSVKVWALARAATALAAAKVVKRILRNFSCRSIISNGWLVVFVECTLHRRSNGVLLRLAGSWTKLKQRDSIARSNVNECNAQASCVVADVMSEVDQRSQRECGIRTRKCKKKCEGWDKNEVGVLKEC